MREFPGKYRFWLKISGLFMLLVVIPYIAQLLTTYHVFQGYAEDNSGKSMEDTMISIGNQVSSMLKTYEDSTMTLYYNGVVDRLETGDPDEDYIGSVLAGISYSYSGIRAIYLVSREEQLFYNGAMQYDNLPDVMRPHNAEIVSRGGRCAWFVTDELFGKKGSNLYILARSLNGKEEKNIGILYYVIGDQMISSAFRKLQMEESLKYMVDSEGRTLYSSGDSPLDEAVWEEIRDVSEGSGYRIIEVQGARMVVAYSRLENTGWTFVGCVSPDAMNDSIQPLIRMIVLVSVIYCLFLMLVFFIFQKSILSPVSELKYAMDQFAGGNLRIRMKQRKVGELKELSGRFNSMAEQINELILRNEAEINEKNNFRIQALTAQLRPHFIYNSLNTIKWMAVINGQENIRRLTESMIYILMHTVSAKKDPYTLKDELELIDQFAVIQKARFMNFDIEKELEPGTEEVRVFQFLLQPMVDNAVVHGFQRGMRKGGRILLRTWTEGDILHITVKDNGCGFDVKKWRQQGEPGENHTNIGLSYVEQLIRLEYGREYGIEIISEPGGGTEIRYRIPAGKGENSDGYGNHCG